MLNKIVLSTLSIFIFTTVVVAKTALHNHRKITVVVYPIEGKLHEYTIDFFNSILEDKFYRSNRFILKNKDMKKTSSLIKEVMKKNSYKKTEQTVQMIGKMFFAKLAIITRIKTYGKKLRLIISVKEVDTLNTLVLKNEEFDNLNALYKQFKNIVSDLRNETLHKYLRPDWVVDFELSFSPVYMIPTGEMQDIVRNGFGGLIGLRAYGLWYHLFVDAELGYIQSRGVNYISDIAHFTSVTLGSGYKIQIKKTYFSIVPRIGAGINISTYYHGENTDVNKRGFFAEPNITKSDIVPLLQVGFRFEYQIGQFRIQLGLLDNILFNNSIANQIIIAPSVIYRF